MTERNYLTEEEFFDDEAVRLGLHFNHGGEEPPIWGSWMRLEDWAKLWLENIQGEKMTRTAYMYERVVEKYMLPKYGKKRLGEINQYELQMFFNELAQTLSQTTIKRIRAIFSGCFEKA